MNSNANIPYQTSLLDSNNDRKRQIDTLKVFNDNVTEIVANYEYSVEFVSGQNKLVMLVILDQDFPQERPMLKITPKISHQWVNENSEITSAPGYLNYSAFSDLGRVVQAIIRELQRNPPPLKVNNTQPLSPKINHYEYPACIPPEENNAEQTFEVTSNIYARLHKMTLNELNSLNDNDDKLTEFCLTLPHIKSIKQTVADVINETNELENKIAKLEKCIPSCKSICSEQMKTMEHLESSCSLLDIKYMELSEVRAPINVKKRLKQAADILDAESEILAEKFLNKEISLNAFLLQYKSLRMKMHELKYKEDHIVDKVLKN